LRVSLEWLADYIDVDLPPEELAEILSMSGTSVERVHSIGKGSRGVVVGRVVDVRPHPLADSLRVAMVEDGSVVREIVCGAPNLREGMKTALAIPGARLPAISDKELRSATIRGVESDGMMCSGAELGISEDAGGILELGDEAPVGQMLNEILPMEDTVLELEITPNRPDCMSMVGIAREVAALTGAAIRMPRVEIYDPGEPVEDLVQVMIYDADECPRYTACVVSGVKVAPSPSWMQRRLLAAGLRPINNLVDVTNYVLLELGQPLHAFDLDLISRNTIVVRSAHQGEQITTLDGVDRQLDSRSLVIADAGKAVALAGIMGGEDTVVTERTVNVLIESACFEPTSILRTSKRLGLRSEASSRFEKGTDPGGTRKAARRAASLLFELAGGTVALGEVDVYPKPIMPVTVELRPARVNELLGTDVSRVDMAEILERLEMGVTGSGETFRVDVPTFRRDLEREVDLIEEIARIYGYGRIAASLPPGGGLDAGLTRGQRLDRSLVEVLVAQGLLETLTYSFMRSSDLDLLRAPGEDRLRDTVKLMNPLAETGEVMRTSILPGLLRVAANNINRGNRDLALFEFGRVFFARSPRELPLEVESVCILLCGQSGTLHWGSDEGPVDFYDLKGLVENLAAYLKIEEVGFEAVDRPHLAPGRGAIVTAGDAGAGYVGQLHPHVAEAFDVGVETYIAELDVGRLRESAGSAAGYRQVGRFPTVKVDIALVVDENLEGRRVEEVIKRQGGALMQSLRLFDVYRGPQVPEGKKSLAYALEFGSRERTLTDEEAHGVLGDIVESLEGALGVTLRGRELKPGEGH